MRRQLQFDARSCGGSSGHPLARYRRLAPAALLAAATGLLGSGLTYAQPTVQPREVAAYWSLGPTKPVWETAIAAGPNEVIAVFNVDERLSPNEIGYAVYHRDGQPWTEGVAPAGDFTEFIDPSIAHACTGDFLAAGLDAPNNRNIVRARYENGQFGDWTLVMNVTDILPDASWQGFDKPWLVAGECGAQGQEYYILCRYHFNVGQGPVDSFAYAHSIDGAEHWTKGLVTGGYDPSNPNDPNNAIIGDACPIPRVYGDRPVYVTYLAEWDKTVPGKRVSKFLKGQDVEDPNDPNAAPVEFRRLFGRSAVGGFGEIPPEPREATVETLVGIVGPPDPNQPNLYLPGQFTHEPGAGFDFAVDPSDPDRLYVVYHDVVEEGSSDVNIYLRTLTRQLGWWLVGPRIRVNNDDDPDEESDQFTPNMTVDTAGRIHVIFYDDRRYIQDDS